jgi:hypothetical protein
MSGVAETSDMMCGLVSGSVIWLWNRQEDETNFFK